MTTAERSPGDDVHGRHRRRHRSKGRERVKGWRDANPVAGAQVRLAGKRRGDGGHHEIREGQGDDDPRGMFAAVLAMCC